MVNDVTIKVEMLTIKQNKPKTKNLVKTIFTLEMGFEITTNSVPSSRVSLKILIANIAVKILATIPIMVCENETVVLAHNCKVLIPVVYGRIIIKHVTVNKKSNQVIHMGLRLIV